MSKKFYQHSGLNISLKKKKKHSSFNRNMFESFDQSLEHVAQWKGSHHHSNDVVGSSHIMNKKKNKF